MHIILYKLFELLFFTTSNLDFLTEYPRFFSTQPWFDFLSKEIKPLAVLSQLFGMLLGGRPLTGLNYILSFSEDFEMNRDLIEWKT